MRKNDKKLFYTLIFLIVFIIIVIMLFAFYQKSSNTSNNSSGKNGYEDETYVPSISYEGENNKYQPSIINKEYSLLNSEDRQNVDERIDWIINAINNKSYSELYSNLTEYYKDIRFKTLEDFTTFLNERFQNGCAYSSFKVDQNCCILTLIGQNVSGETQNVKIYIHGYEENTLREEAVYFEDILEIERSESMFYSPEIVVNVKYTIEYNDKTAAFVEIENLLNKEANVDFKYSKMKRVYAGMEKSYKVVNEPNIKIGAGEKAVLEIQFDYPGTSIYRADTIQYLFEVNGQGYTKEILIEYDDEEIEVD